MPLVQRRTLRRGGGLSVLIGEAHRFPATNGPKSQDPKKMKSVFKRSSKQVECRGLGSSREWPGGGSGEHATIYMLLREVKSSGGMCKDRHDLNCDAVLLLGLRNSFAASVPQYKDVARPSSEKKLRALVATGKISASSLWQTVGAVAITSTVVFAVQAPLLEVKELKAREVEEAEAAAQAATIAAAVGVRDRRGDLPDSDMGLQGLKVAVKFAHVERELTGASKIATKAACVEYLANLNPPLGSSLPPPADAGPGSGSTPFLLRSVYIRRKRKTKERPHSP